MERNNVRKLRYRVREDFGRFSVVDSWRSDYVVFWSFCYNAALQIAQLCNDAFRFRNQFEEGK